MAQRYFIDISYKGTNYNGWQIQNNAVTVQQCINEAISTILQLPVKVQGASRTDAGVHAGQNFAHFDAADSLPDNFLHRINLLLPKDIVINNIHPVASDKNTRFDAVSRTYKYILYFNKNPFLEGFAYYYPFTRIDLEQMNKAAAILCKYHDFTAFCKLNTQVKTKICNLAKAEWQHADHKKQLVFNIVANRFLRGMVRGIVGTLIKVGINEYTIADFENIVKNKQRSKVDFSPPACGLYLTKVQYPFKLSAN